MKKVLILSVMCALINFSSITQSYPIKYIAESTENTVPNNPSELPEEVTKPDPVTNNVEMDGAIGPWNPKDKDLPNFGEFEDGDENTTENKPQEGDYFTISVTTPLNMNFVIINENGNGSSSFGKFVSPYHSITNNGTYPLNVSLNSFTKADERGNSDSIVRSNSSNKDTNLYVEEPIADDGKVQMRLSLNYDRPQQGTYLKTIDLHNLSSRSDRMLGQIDGNETARLYYRSDLWETPFSEDIEADVVSNFNLVLTFSILENVNTEGSDNNPNGQQPPSESNSEETENN